MSAASIGTSASSAAAPIEAVFLGRARAAGRADDRQRPRAPSSQEVAGIDRHAEMIDPPAEGFDRGRESLAPVGGSRGAENQQHVHGAPCLKAPWPERSFFMGDALIAHDARPAGSSRASNTRIVLATTLGFSPAAGSRQRRCAGRRPRGGRRPPLAASSALPSARRGTAKGMILTVATMFAGRNGRGMGERGGGDRSSTPLILAISRASTTTRPAASANRLTRPGEGALVRRLAPAMRSQAGAPPRPRDLARIDLAAMISHPRRLERRLMLRGDTWPFLSTGQS